jgi:hypothetical protein
MKMKTIFEDEEFGEDEFEEEDIEGEFQEFIELKGKIQFYSPENLLFAGRGFLKESNYPNAKVIFDELSERCPKMKRVSNLYTTLIEIEENELPNPVEEITTQMIEAINLYSEGTIKKEDLFTIEKIVDKETSNEEMLKTRRFLKVYSKFKEYNLNVFLEDNSKDKPIFL